MKFQNSRNWDDQDDNIIDHVNNSKDQKKHQSIDTLSFCRAGVLHPEKVQWATGGCHYNPHDNGIGAGKGCGNPVHYGEDAVNN